MHKEGLSAADALAKLKEGNARYMSAVTNPGDISPAIRKDTCENGQSPYAVVVACSDSRVIPEGIFTLALCFVPTFVVCYLLLGLDIRSGILNLLSIIMILVDTIGLMAVWGISYNAVSLINLVTVTHRAGLGS